MSHLYYQIKNYFVKRIIVLIFSFDKWVISFKIYRAGWMEIIGYGRNQGMVL